MTDVASEIGVSPEVLTSNLIVMPNFMLSFTEYCVWSECCCYHIYTIFIYVPVCHIFCLYI